MADDFSDFDDLPEDRITAFRKLKAGGLLVGSSLEGSVALISDRRFESDFPGAVCYLPEEMNFLLSLSDEDVKKVHSMKRKFDGFFEIGKDKTDATRQTGPAI